MVDEVSNVKREQGQEIMGVTWKEIDIMVDVVHANIKSANKTYSSIYGIPRGGLIVATILSHRLNIPVVTCPLEMHEDTLIVDDIADSGNTLSDKYYQSKDTVALFYRSTSKVKPTYHAITLLNKDWILFPWEIN